MIEGFNLSQILKFAIFVIQQKTHSNMEPSTYDIPFFGPFFTYPPTHIRFFPSIKLIFDRWYQIFQNLPTYPRIWYHMWTLPYRNIFAVIEMSILKWSARNHQHSYVVSSCKYQEFLFDQLWVCCTFLIFSSKLRMLRKLTMSHLKALI